MSNYAQRSINHNVLDRILNFKIKTFENSVSVPTVARKGTLLFLSKEQNCKSGSWHGFTTRRVEMCDLELHFSRYTLFSSPFWRRSSPFFLFRPLGFASFDQVLAFYCLPPVHLALLLFQRRCVAWSPDYVFHSFTIFLPYLKFLLSMSSVLILTKFQFHWPIWRTSRRPSRWPFLRPIRFILSELSAI